MQNPLRTSKKKIDSEIMYEMRRQGMTNNTNAKNLGVAVKTVYNHIGKMPYAVKNAEAQNKQPVVDTPVVGKPAISAENGFKPFEMKPKVEPPCEKALACRSECEIHHAGRNVPVCHRHRRWNGGTARRRKHGDRHAGQRHHPALYQ